MIKSNNIFSGLLYIVFVYTLQITPGFAQSQNILHKEFSNGINLLYINDISANNIALDFVFTGGVEMERADYDGFAQFVAHAFDIYFAQQYPKQIKGESIQYVGLDLRDTYLTFSFTTNNVNNITTVSEAVTQAIRNISDDFIENQLQSYQPKLNTSGNLVVNWFDRQMVALYGKEAASRTLHQHLPEAYTLKLFKRIHQQYFTPDNVLMIVKGGQFSNTQLSRMLSGVVTQWKPMIRDGVAYKPIAYRTPKYITHQKITENNIPASVLIYSYPIEGLKLEREKFEFWYNRVEAYKDFYKEHPQLLNFDAFILPNKFSSTLNLVFTVAHENLPSFLSNHQLTEAHESAIAFKNGLQPLNELPIGEQIQRLKLWWSVGMFNGFELTSFMPPANEYNLASVPYAALLVTDPAEIEKHNLPQLWPNFNNETGSQTFTFLENAAVLTGDTSNLNVLKSWMLANTAINIHIEGVAFKGEYLKNRTPELIDFATNTLGYKDPTYSVWFDQKSVRLDIARALVVMKYLVDAGIKKERITISGNIEKKTEPRYVTIVSER